MEIELDQRLKSLRGRYFGEDVVDLLSQETPKEWVAVRKGRGGDYSYVPGPYFIEMANICFGGLWSCEVPEVIVEGNHVVAKVRVTVKVPGRVWREGEQTVRVDSLEVVKEQFGSSEIKRYSSDEPTRNPRGDIVYTSQKEVVYSHRAGDVIDLGDDYKAATTDGMKKCLMQFGMFEDVYKRNESKKEQGGVSREQLAAVYMRGKKAGMSEEETESWAQERLGKPLSDCEQLEVMRLIPPLIELAKTAVKVG